MARSVAQIEPQLGGRLNLYGPGAALPCVFSILPLIMKECQISMYIRRTQENPRFSAKNNVAICDINVYDKTIIQPM